MHQTWSTISSIPVADVESSMLWASRNYLFVKRRQQMTTTPGGSSSKYWRLKDMPVSING